MSKILGRVSYTHQNIKKVALILSFLPLFLWAQTSVPVSQVTKHKEVLKPNQSFSFSPTVNQNGSFRIFNNSDTVMKLVLKPNDTIRLTDPDKPCAKILITAKGTRAVRIKLYPKASLILDFKKNQMEVTNNGQGKARIKLRNGSDFTIIRDTSNCKTELKKAETTSDCCCEGSHSRHKKEGDVEERKWPYCGCCCCCCNAHFSEHENNAKHGIDYDCCHCACCCCCHTSHYANENLKKEEDKKEDKGGTKYEKISLNFRIYNDANGFFRDQTNALLQSEISFNVPVNRRPFYSNSKFKCYFLKNVMFPNIKLIQLKNDSSYRFAPVHYFSRRDTIVDSTIHIHTLNLVRYSNFNVSAKVNILAIQSRNRSFSLFVDLYGAFYRSGLSYADTILLKHLGIKKEDANFHVHSAGYGFNVKMKYAPPGAHFSLEGSLSQFGLNLYSNDVRQNYGKLYNPDYNTRNDAFGNLKLKPDFNPYSNGIGEYSFQVRYCAELTNDKNPTGKGFFFRVNFFNSPFVAIEGGKADVNYNNNYLQIQTGISRDLSELLKFLGLSN